MHCNFYSAAHEPDHKTVVAIWKKKIGRPWHKIWRSTNDNFCCCICGVDGSQRWWRNIDFGQQLNQMHATHYCCCYSVGYPSWSSGLLVYDRSLNVMPSACRVFRSTSVPHWRASIRMRLKLDGTRWRTGGEVKGKLANGVGSQYSTLELGVSDITNADAHTSAASSRLKWPTHPRRFKWTRPFRRKTKSGFCACAITFQAQLRKGRFWTK